MPSAARPGKTCSGGGGWLSRESKRENGTEGGEWIGEKGGEQHVPLEMRSAGATLAYGVEETGSYE